MHLLAKLLIAATVYEGSVHAKDQVERHRAYNVARRYCNVVGKPLLLIGRRSFPWEPPNGDITLDLDPRVLNTPGGVCADVRNMPFDDKTFGFSINSHVLEHLASAEDVEMAISECARVADYAVLLCPSPYSITSTFFAPSHKLRLWFDQVSNKIVVRPNKWRTGIGVHSGVSQLMVVEEIKLPAIITESGPLPKGFVPA